MHGRTLAASCVLLIALGCGSKSTTIDGRLAQPVPSDAGGIDKGVEGSTDAGQATDLGPDREPDPAGPDAASVVETVFPVDAGHSDGEAVDVVAVDGGGSTLPGQIRGVVLAPWGRGVAGRKVVIGERTAVSGAYGVFTIEQAPAVYDAVISEPDGSTVSVYRGLTRRDPILLHKTSVDVTGDPAEACYQAVVSGTISGSFPFPVGEKQAASVYFFAEGVASVWQLGRPLLGDGPGYGPWTITWGSAPSLAGKIVAIGALLSQKHIWESAFMVEAPLTLVAGGTAVQGLTLQPIPNGRIAGSIRMYAGNRATFVRVAYRLASPGGGLALGEFSADGTYDCLLPDLSTLGGDYCVSVVDALGLASAERCGASLGMTDFSIQIPSPPEIVSPADDTPVTKDSKFSWTGVASAIYVADFIPSTRTAQHVQVYTAGTSLRWSELQAMGIPFTSGIELECQVSALLPYASMDALASSVGPTSALVDKQVLRSSSITVTAIR